VKLTAGHRPLTESILPSIDTVCGTGWGVGTGDGPGAGEGVGEGTVGAALCDTRYVWPPTVTAPARAAPVFIATLKLTVAEAEPLAPLLTVSHGESAEADHVHPDTVFTWNVSEPPDAPTEPLLGLMLNVHAAAS
jgi:hypothetical protein